jgi:hypothetical protein
MNNRVLRIEIPFKVFSIFYDECSSYLYDDLWENDVTFLSNHRDYRSQGDNKNFDIEEVIETQGACLDKGYTFAVVNAYIHSGIALSLSKFDCQWDSGLFGLLIFREGEFGKDNIGLEGFIRSWAAILNGEIYGFRLDKVSTCASCSHTHEDEIDSCWGFYGYESMKDMVSCMLELLGCLSTKEKKEILSKIN